LDETILSRNIQRQSPGTHQILRLRPQSHHPYDVKKHDNINIPLYEAASSKLAQKTHVDMMSKVQVNIYAAGLHRQGSNAVHHYTRMEMKDHFALMNVAFGQPLYHVDKDLNVIDEA